jgi:predicted nucleic acid-binding protein
MTARAFADTNIAIYAEGSDIGKAQRATAILESSPVISSQVVTETISTLTRKYGFTLSSDVAARNNLQIQQEFRDFHVGQQRPHRALHLAGRC